MIEKYFTEGYQIKVNANYIFQCFVHLGPLRSHANCRIPSQPERARSTVRLARFLMVIQLRIAWPEAKLSVPVFCTCHLFRPRNSCRQQCEACLQVDHTRFIVLNHAINSYVSKVILFFFVYLDDKDSSLAYWARMNEWII